MCSDGWKCKATGVCPDCGEPTDENGDAAEGCFWSPITCHTCGARPCDGAC